MSAEVKPGYKLTEVGMIPDDWSILTVSDVGSVITGGTPSTLNKENWGGEYPWVTPSDISSDIEISSTERMLTEEGIESIKILPADSVLVTCIASIGKVAILKKTGGCNQQINAVVPRAGFSPRYLYYYFVSSRQYLLSNAGITATPIVSKGVFQDMLVRCPPYGEQLSISQSLSEVDALIGKLDQLIVKKRDIKQAAMQQLLTGQKRLPGFSGEWEVKRLGDLVTRMANGAVYIRDEKNGVPITRIETISSGVIDWGRIGYAKANPELAQYEMQSGDILYSHINSLDHIGKVALYSGPESLYHGMNLILLRPNSNANAAFLFMLLGSDMIRQKARVLAKQAVSQASINTTELKSMELRLPEHNEQVAIATILSDMDAELAALEARRDKARQLKQGMMQELLTGRIRLV